MNKYFKDPLIHFIILGVIVFFSHSIWQRNITKSEYTINVTEEEMIDLILKTTLFKRDVLLRREEEEPGFIEKTYLQKIRNKKREDLENQ